MKTTFRGLRAGSALAGLTAFCAGRADSKVAGHVANTIPAASNPYRRSLFMTPPICLERSYRNWQRCQCRALHVLAMHLGSRSRLRGPADDEFGHQFLQRVGMA